MVRLPTEDDRKQAAARAVAVCGRAHPDCENGLLGIPRINRPWQPLLRLPATELTSPMHLSGRPPDAAFVSFDQSLIRRAKRAGASGISGLSGA